jgi:hypothetical protein
MSVKERRTTHWEWSCDGPECDKVERMFERGKPPTGWLSAPVTDRTIKAFHSSKCADAYWSSLLYPPVAEVAILPEDGS